MMRACLHLIPLLVTGIVFHLALRISAVEEGYVSLFNGREPS
jgi:hypothetical protein